MDENFIDKLALIYLKDGKLLCTRSKGKDAWFMPGGKREAGESDVQALIREVKEELAVDLLKKTIKPYGVFSAQAHGKPEGVMVRMTCYTAEFSGEPVPSSEVEEIAFLQYADKPKTTLASFMLFDDLHEKDLLV